MVNQAEEKARVRKATRLAIEWLKLGAHLYSGIVTPAIAAQHATPEMIEKLAENAGVNRPSDLTWSLVVVILTELQEEGLRV